MAMLATPIIGFIVGAGGYMSLAVLKDTYTGKMPGPASAGYFIAAITGATVLGLTVMSRKQGYLAEQKTARVRTMSGKPVSETLRKLKQDKNLSAKDARTRKEIKAESFAAEHYILKNEDEEIIIQMTDDWTTIDNATEIIEMLVDKSWEDWSSNPLEGEVGEGDKDLVIHFQDNEGNILRTRGYHVKGNRANDTIIQWFSDYDYPIGGY
jgi:hypothetical protein